MATQTGKTQTRMAQPQPIMTREKESSSLIPNHNVAVSVPSESHEKLPTTYPMMNIVPGITVRNPRHVAHGNNSAFTHSPQQVHALPVVGNIPAVMMRQKPPFVPGKTAIPVAPASSVTNASLAVAGTTDPAEAPNYKDYSRLPMEGVDQDVLLSPNSNSASGKDPSFPVKLHRILSMLDHEEFITWLPHGRSWRVLKPKAFEAKVIPLYFRHAKYASFMRQVNGWGFRRVTQGPDHNSYYHELFLRGLPHLCDKMQRPPKIKASSSTSAETNTVHPDFYHLSLVAPLPSTTASRAVVETPQPSTPTAVVHSYPLHQQMARYIPQHQHPTAYVTSMSTSPTEGNSAEGSGEGSGEESGEGGPHLTNYDEGDDGGGSSGDDKGPASSGDSSDTNLLSGGVTLIKGCSSASSAYAGGSEGGGDSSSDSNSSSDDKDRPVGLSQDQQKNVSSSSLSNDKSNESEKHGIEPKKDPRTQQRARGGSKRRSSSFDSEKRCQKPRNGNGAFGYPVMGGGPMQQMMQFPGSSNMPCIVVQQGSGGSQGGSQMMFQQQPQMVRVVNQNGGEIGYIQLPNPCMQGQAPQFIQPGQMIQGQNPRFVQPGQIMQGMSTFVPQQGQMMQSATMQQQQVIQPQQAVQQQQLMQQVPQQQLQQQMFHPQLMVRPPAPTRTPFQRMPTPTLPFQAMRSVPRQGFQQQEVQQ